MKKRKDGETGGRGIGEGEGRTPPFESAARSEKPKRISSYFLKHVLNSS